MAIEERPYCYRCLRPAKACFCEHVTEYHTRTRFVLLMHPMEAKKSHVGTGRLTKLSVPNSEIIVGINFDQEKRYCDLLADEQYACFVLYPGKESLNLSEQKFECAPGKTPLIFIIDGTWPCAKKMMKMTASLQELPRVSFTVDQKSEFSMKQQPADFCLSTIESVKIVLAELKRQGLETFEASLDDMLIPLRKTSDFHIRCANDPNLNHYQRPSFKARAPQVRKPSKKWEKRNICF